MKCCKNEIILKRQTTGEKLYWMQCEVCRKHGKGKTQGDAEKAFKWSKEGIATLSTNPPPTTTKELQPVPRDRSLNLWSQQNMPALMNQSAQFIDKPETRRMIEANIRYIANLKGNAWDKVWDSPEGQESISHALSEANYYAATLGKMGDLVPFGSTCEFIASAECFKFALETGRNAPFKDINILLVHEYDKERDAGIENGNFYIKFKHGFPRGEVIAIAVYGTRTDTGNVIGEVYDVDRLMAKAEAHSAAYRSYLETKVDFQKMRSEGKLKTTAAGREYYEELIEYTKKGKKESFTKKIFEGDAKNPYDGADRPEMLRKSAGKTFFRPYMKTRNAAAMADEWDAEAPENRDQAADNVLNKAADQFTDIPVKDAEIITECKDGCKYSKSMDQEYPRKCIRCGTPETETDQDKNKSKAGAKTNEEKQTDVQSGSGGNDLEIKIEDDVKEL